MKSRPSIGLAALATALAIICFKEDFNGEDPSRDHPLHWVAKRVKE